MLLNRVFWIVTMEGESARISEDSSALRILNEVEAAAFKGLVRPHS
uniref:Uncharacterized protein n=1 Tax=Physcomitrium patens TaxID=3218 RepID=A0A2K1JS44_PHYPA|nr:hypothetical protein PHYPA_016735 [Physcomitrium patens]